ncbi:MAG: Guanylate kinase [Syntrophomonadaceae bacterium]|nr:Guanylate kinase [Bacillota bacterium]
MLYVIIGPSGAGKTSIMECLLARHPNALARVVTATTRAPRQGEVHGREYLFLSQQEFSQTQVLAATKIDGEDYGIPVSSLSDHIGKKHDQIIILDVAGAREIKKAFGKNAKVIFISAGYMALRDRLIKRGDNLTSVDLRLKDSATTMRAMADASLVDAIIQNDEGYLQTVVDAVVDIIAFKP